MLLPAIALGQQEHVIGALSQNSVQITANFNGSEIWVFGAVRRDAPIPTDKGPLDVIVTVRGPNEKVTVRKKSRVLGIWVNTKSLEIDVAPSFYTIATTRPLNEIITPVERFRYGLGFDNAIQVYGTPDLVDDPQEFRNAVVRIRKNNLLYSQQEGTIDLDQETLFRTKIALPSNLVEGFYTARMFLVRDGEVINVTNSTIDVRKTGLEKLIYLTAHTRPKLYGIVSIAVALFAGWLASFVFQLLRR